MPTTRRGLSGITIAVALAVAALLCACAEHRALELRPGTGDLAFRARWTGTADLDLSVTSPLGEHLAFDSTTAPSGGLHDIDCNYSTAHVNDTRPGEQLHGSDAMPAIDRHLCAHPMENIFWPRRRAPAGIYRVLLYLANPNTPPTAADTFTLEVYVRGNLRVRKSGRAAELAAKPLDFGLDYR